MRIGGSHGAISLCLFLAAGALLGAIVGQVLGQANLTGLMPYLTQTYEIFNFKDLYLNLAIIEIHFGLRFAPNLISIIGLLLATWLYNRF